MQRIRYRHILAAGEYQVARGFGFRRGKYRGNKTLFGNNTVVEYRNVIAHLFNNAHLVGYYYNGYAELFVYVAYKFKYRAR